MSRIVTSIDEKYLIVEKETNGVPILILTPKDYCATDSNYFKMGGFELFNLVETYAEYIEAHKRCLDAAKEDLYDWEKK